MKSKRVMSIIVIIVGAILLFFSNYIADQIAAGRLQVASGQRQVDTANTIFSQSQYTKPFGKAFTGSGQERINAGKAEIASYESLQGKLQIGGIVLIVLGIAMLVFWRD